MYLQPAIFTLNGLHSSSVRKITFDMQINLEFTIFSFNRGNICVGYTICILPILNSSSSETIYLIYTLRLSSIDCSYLTQSFS